jgi:RNA polymerase sigma factor (sigma-70 family)
MEVDSDGEIEIDIPTTADHESADQRLVLQKALQNLPEHYQEIIVMRFADGLTFAEIAEMRGQSLEAVKSLYRRSIQAMRDQIGEESSGL